MHRGMRKPYGLKVGRYAARMIDINDYLAVLHGAKESGKIVRQNLMKFC